MREIRTYGSEGGEVCVAASLFYPYRVKYGDFQLIFFKTTIHGQTLELRVPPEQE